MRRIWTTLLALPLVFASCSETPAADTKPAAGTIEVSIGSGPKIGIRTGAQTRTELDEDGESVRWVDNDRIVLWAVNSQAQTTIDRQVFKLWHYNAEYNTAKFTATVPEMPEDTYVYYTVSPEPVSAEGLKASYRIPAEQDGTFSGDCDIMVAAPVEGTALQQGDNSEMVNLEFDHKVHVLMIRIPSNDLGEEISKITLTFPEPVAGTLTVDAADPAAAPQLTDGSNILTLSFDTPKKPGDTVYAVIAPVELTSEQEVTITATGTTRESRPKTFPGKHFAEGHTTPISYSIPPVGPTTLRVSLPDTGKSTLGENITSFTLTAAEGVDLSGEGSNVLTFPVETAGNFDYVFDDFPETLAGQSVSVSYESENTEGLSGGTFNIPELMAGGTTSIATLSVPYLMEEDFSRITSDFSGPEEMGNADGVELTNYGLPGWYAGARSKGYVGTSIALRSYSNIGGPYHSRLNSCKLTNIKDGKTVTISVSFNGDWKKNKSSSMSLTVGRATGTKLNDAINSSTSISLSNNSSASTTNIPTSHTVRIGDFTNAQFIAWKTAGQNGTMFNYDDVYLDNIKVSIANE
ncbi:fimbrillin family protein [Alistipes senegalensis]|uniref:fimbrillin family protein n=1 Tax=Alistipes senegalensis TaxID=1288121 RepID=UPI00242DD081|nr:fimbrillin family protein [Alistipes senegalensis]MCI7309100.1 fimbrillin family protein [Alistipes senegalensis]MDD7039679.1 fimbrillin family protein [Alistipes senegalensis]MDY2877117.1 fimbrillin family protein [Alistipes senegalensis]